MIPLLPKKANEDYINDFSKSLDIENYFGENYNYYTLGSGTSSIEAISLFLKLNRNDEAFISTTSDSMFVSSCVTSTLFNRCKVSRVLTEKTKLIFVIHEFGFQNPDLDMIMNEAIKRNIPVVEDCAHFISDVEPFVGQRGDFVIHSLPKIFPVTGGGILKYKKSIKGLESIVESNRFEKHKDSMKEYLTYIKEINNRRRDIYKLYRDNVKANQVFDFKESDVPFIYAFKTDKWKVVEEALKLRVELGRNYVPFNVLVPVNPFVDKKEHQEIISLINSIL